MSQQNRDDEARLPRQGVMLVAGFVVGIFAGIWMVGFIWRLFTR